MTGWTRALRAVVAVALALTVYFVVPVETHDRDLAVRLMVSLLALGLLTAGVIWQVMRHVEDPGRQIDGLLLALVVAVLAFALAFFRLEAVDPGQIPGLATRVDALYFTMTTLLTIGYGDIHAAGQGARVLVLIAMVFNVAVIATAVSTVTSRVRKHAEEVAAARREAATSDPQHRPAPGRRTRRKPR